MSALAKIETAKPELMALAQMNHPSLNNEAVKGLILNELSHFANIVMVKPKLNDCTTESIVAAVKQAVRKNLTLDPTAGLMYLTPRGVNIGTKEKPQWIQILEAKETVNGLLSVALQSRSILDFEHPEVTTENGKVVKVSMKIQKASGRWETREFTQVNFEKWMKASRRQNTPFGDQSGKEWANPLYFSQAGGIDEQFARTKCIRHSMTNLGTNMNMISAQRVEIQKPIKVVETEYAEVEVLENANENAQGVYVQTHEIIDPNKM